MNSTAKLSPLISPDELLSIYQTGELILIDAGSLQKYRESHLKGAVHVDLDSQLAAIGPDPAEGGRHPLPSPEQFAVVLGNLGIGPESYVIIYDDKQGSNAAARMWWMLKAVGHLNVRVLDGGFQAAVKSGFPIQSDPVMPSRRTIYPPAVWTLPLADISQVDRASREAEFMIVDVRDENRYKGITEPIDLIAGHIPNAVNIPFTGNLDQHGMFLPADVLNSKYSKAFEKFRPENIIVHCGSGVTACHTLLAVAAAGMEIPSLYVGSWSEWSRTDRPIAREDD
jgi:thiosulfate/3-mercaptopyruvate sulfurtransferase